MGYAKQIATVQIFCIFKYDSYFYTRITTTTKVLFLFTLDVDLVEESGMLSMIIFGSAIY
jgi:hypothetical protein